MSPRAQTAPAALTLRGYRVKRLLALKQLGLVEIALAVFRLRTDSTEVA